MKFLVDENLSARLAQALVDSGHDAIHVTATKVSGCSDPDVMALALAEQRTIISADTDFGALLASSRAVAPSVILVRELVTLPPHDLAAIVTNHLDLIQAHLEIGAIFAFGPRGIRVRDLPLR